MVIQSEETGLWRVELDRETVRIPKAKGGGEREAWVVRTFKGVGIWEHFTDVEWAAVQYFENRVAELRREFGEEA